MPGWKKYIENTSLIGVRIRRVIVYCRKYYLVEMICVKFKLNGMNCSLHRSYPIFNPNKKKKIEVIVLSE